MDTKKAGQLLDRITALHKSLTLVDDDDISSIERDLMLSYLRRLYDLYHSPAAEQPKSRVAPKPTPPAPRPVPPVEPDPVIAAPAPPPIVPPPPSPAPPPPPDAVPPPVVPVQEKPRPAPVAPPVPPAPVAKKIPAKIAKLFTQPEARELSERLSRQPVKDLTRALTINDRVQFSNVLFGGNADLMNSVLKRLNTYADFDTAKPDLVELADQFDWSEGESAEVAQNFIKLVSRRYV